MKQLAFDFVPPTPTLENFVAGRNVEAVERLRALAAGQGGERSVYLWGAPSSGRTHLMRGAVSAFEGRGVRAAYIAGGAGLASETAATADMVAIDDADRLDESAQVAVFNLYNRLRDAGGVLLAAGNAPPPQLKLRADVVTRLAWGLVYEVHALSDAEKAQALAGHAEARGFSMRPEICEYLLTRVRRDMRTLIGMLDALDRYSLEAKRPVTLTLVRELVQEIQK